MASAIWPMVVRRTPRVRAAASRLIGPSITRGAPILSTCRPATRVVKPLAKGEEIRGADIPIAARDPVKLGYDTGEQVATTKGTVFVNDPAKAENRSGAATLHLVHRTPSSDHIEVDKSKIPITLFVKCDGADRQARSMPVKTWQLRNELTAIFAPS
jgi:hypothetical protein